MVVEDEVKVAQRLRNGHSENGQWADLTHDVIEGRRLASGGEYDLVLLDVTLPGVDGSGVLPARSQLWCKTPRLMLTARDEVEDHFSGLEGGADDHLVMPFAFSEMLARVGALLRCGAVRCGAATATATPQWAAGSHLHGPCARRARPMTLCSQSISRRLSSKLALVTMPVVGTLIFAAWMSLTVLAMEKGTEELLSRVGMIKESVELESRAGRPAADLARLLADAPMLDSAQLEIRAGRGPRGRAGRSGAAAVRGG